MGIFEELAEEFGVGHDSPEALLAADLAAADEHFLIKLVELRRVAGFTQEELGAAWGRHKTAVSQFEKPGADPRLSTIRRYAASIGARYVHYVELDGRFHESSDEIWEESPEIIQDWAFENPLQHRRPELSKPSVIGLTLAKLDTRIEELEPQEVAIPWADEAK